MGKDGAFEFGFGKIHVRRQTQKLRNNRILDEFQFVLQDAVSDFISVITASFFGDCNSRW